MYSSIAIGPEQLSDATQGGRTEGSIPRIALIALHVGRIGDHDSEGHVLEGHGHDLLIVQ